MDVQTDRLPDTVPELIRMRVSAMPDATACAHRVAPGQWQVTRWADLWTDLLQTVAVLRQLGVQPGDHVAILARTCREWYLFEHAGMLAGAVIVGIDSHASPSHIKTILAETSPRVLVCEQCTPDLVESIADSTHVIQLDEDSPTPSRTHGSLWSEVVKREPAAQPDALPTVRPGDPATLIYTSGTTGDPKAIRITHRQLMVACRAIAEIFPLQEDDSTICWLPMAHLFQRMLNLVAIAQGTTIHFVDDPREVVRCSREVGPAIFIGVPRFFEKLHEGIQQHISQLPPLRRKLLRTVIRSAAIHKTASGSGQPLSAFQRLKQKLFARLVLRRLHEIMGPNIRFMITGSAPIAPSLLEFFWAIGWPLFEAYGISENTVPIATNRPGETRFGSVGKPFRQNDLRLARDGEILVKGEGLFDGYWNEAHRNDRLTGDGYYHTGDIGRFDDDGYLYLIGRKCDTIKTSTGRRIAPNRIEAVYSQSKFVNHVVVVGNGRKHVVAVCTLNRSAIEEQLEGLGTERDVSEEHLAQDPEVKELLFNDFASRAQSLNPHERVVAFATLPRQLSVERGELTSSLKVRRMAVEHNWRQEIERLYRKESETVTTRREVAMR